MAAAGTAAAALLSLPPNRSDFSLAGLQVATTPSRTRSFRPWPRGEAPRPREERSFSAGNNLDWCVLRHGPVGLVHVDAHADTSDLMLGEKIAHGTPFRRCVEEGLLDRERVVQIGLRGSGYSADAYEWSRAQVCSTGADNLDWLDRLDFIEETSITAASEVINKLGILPLRASVWSRWRSAGFGP